MRHPVVNGKKQCSKCGEMAPATREYWYGELQQPCKKCQQKYGRQWSKNNREKARIAGTRRWAQESALPKQFSEYDWNRCLEYWNGKCAVCERDASDELRIVKDHWIPVTSDSCPGLVAWNVVPLCHGLNGCNNSKNNSRFEYRTVAIHWLTQRIGIENAEDKLKQIEDYFASVTPL